jgi:hypothetical protein
MDALCLFIDLCTKAVIRKNIIREGLPLLFVGLIDLPIEWILIGASGRIVSHYLMVLLPVLSLCGINILGAILLAVILGHLNENKNIVFIRCHGDFRMGFICSIQEAGC